MQTHAHSALFAAIDPPPPVHEPCTGYSTTDITAATPTITKLGNEGVILSRYYTLPDCTPARSTVLSGRYPITSGMSHSIVDLDSNWGLPTEYDLIGKKLGLIGYGM